MKARIDLFLTFAVLTVGLAVLTTKVHDYLKTREQFVHAGEQFPHMGSLDFSTHEETLLLVLKEDCSFCAASFPFYKKIEQEVSQLKDRPQITILVPGPSYNEERQLSHFNIHLPVVGGVSLQDIRISGTPTLIALDRNGIIKKVWLGQLRPSEEQKVLASLHVTSSLRGPSVHSSLPSTASGILAAVLSCSELNCMYSWMIQKENYNEH